MRVGMNMARLNFAHGTLDSHRQVIQRIRGWTDNF
jgi:pyruvate kinase